MHVIETSGQREYKRKTVSTQGAKLCADGVIGCGTEHPETRAVTENTMHCVLIDLARTIFKKINEIAPGTVAFSIPAR
ncbi:MAG: hypothetical protein CEE38_21280 [Planctomycetes bacterium B3_Pla]|nr:MAG: hypothetical protein CEE38_21280 [Planctomycetes bacterium B3_Pla]